MWGLMDLLNLFEKTKEQNALHKKTRFNETNQTLYSNTAIYTGFSF